MQKGLAESWAWPNQKENFEEHYAPANWEIKGGVQNMGCCDRIGDVVIDIASSKGNVKDFGGGNAAFEGDNDDDEEDPE